jgi:N-acyl-D-amino-acid deacylase
MRFAVENYNRDPDEGTTVPPPSWDTLFVHGVSGPENETLLSRSIGDIARERGDAPADIMLDLALSEDLTTTFRWDLESPEWIGAVGESQHDPHMIIGVSDGGAHLGKDDGADWSSYFLRSWVMDRNHWSLEEGIRQITHVPASLVGLADRGLIRPGGWADMMIFDPATVGPGHKEFVHDLPGGVARYKSWPQGIAATIVNGVPIVADGQLTDDLPGQVVGPCTSISGA